MCASSSATSKSRNPTSVDNYGTDSRQCGRKSNPNVGGLPEKSKANPGDEDDMQQHHGNTVNFE